MGSWLVACCVLAWLAFAPGPADAATRTVGPGGDFQTIQAGIGGSDAGDSLLVETATYYEHLILDRAITLVRADSAAVVTVRPDTLNPVAAPLLQVTAATHPSWPKRCWNKEAWGMRGDGVFTLSMVTSREWCV